MYRFEFSSAIIVLNSYRAIRCIFLYILLSKEKKPKTNIYNETWLLLIWFQCKNVGNSMVFFFPKVFDDVVVELAMAVLQYFNSKPGEEHSFRCMKSLARFCQISRQDVPQLVQMIGPPPSTFKGMSSRIDEQIDEIQNYLRWWRTTWPYIFSMIVFFLFQL